MDVKRILKFKSIQTKILFVIIIFLVIPLIFITYSYTKTTEEIIRNKIKNDNILMLDQLSSQIETEMDKMINATNYFAASRKIKQVLLNGNINYENNYKAAEQQYYKNYIVVSDIIEIVQNIILQGKNNYITLFDLHGNNYTSKPIRSMDKDEKWRNTEWFNKTISLNGYLVWTFHKDEDTQEYLITLSRLINESINNKWSGVITITVNEEQWFNDILKKYNQENVFIVDKEGNIISHTNREKVGSNIYYSNIFKHIKKGEMNHSVLNENNQKVFISYKIIEKPEWYLVKISDYNTLFHNLINLRTNNLIILGLVLMLFIIVMLIIILSITQPIKKLMVKMKKVEEGNFNLSISVSGEDEIAQLGQSFNKMVIKINNLIKSIQEEQKKEEELKLQVLYAQINPHFLFNTLNTIKWIALINQSENVANLIGDLGRLLEMSIKDIDVPITVEEELNNLKSYLSIKKARYNQRYEIEINVDEKILRYKVPKLILQPIVENSLIHGLEKNRENNMKLTISGGVKNNKMFFKIEDDGKGIKKEKLDNILKSVKDTSNKGKFSGIGLENVDQRVKMMFGKEYGLQIKSILGKGTTVLIWLPIQEGS